MNQFLRLERTIGITLLVVCLAVIVPFEIFNEMQSLDIIPASHEVCQIRMINFFNMGHVIEQPTEAIYVSYAIVPADYGGDLLRLASFIRHILPVIQNNIKNYSRQCLVFVSILCFFIFYQSSRTTSEADPLYG